LEHLVHDERNIHHVSLRRNKTNLMRVRGCGWVHRLVLLTAASFGMYADRTRLGAAFSGPVCAMLFTAVLSNFNILPPPGPLVTEIQVFKTPVRGTSP
jgi:hypothetical protein